MTKKILIPLPLFDFDPTEAAVPWKILVKKGIEVSFATPEGKVACADLKILTGKSLGFLAPLLQADKNGRAAYAEMSSSQAFLNPLSWEQIQSEDWNGLLLPGGHDKGMREYLESKILQKVIVDFFQAKKPVGAICHGTVLVARSLVENRCFLFGNKTTALLKTQELSAWALTSLWLGNYYRTYNETVESEVKRSLASASDFIKGALPLRRDSLSRLESGFTVLDGNYLSARWPGDAHKFGMEFVKMLNLE